MRNSFLMINKKQQKVITYSSKIEQDNEKIFKINNNKLKSISERMSRLVPWRNKPTSLIV